MTFRMDPFSCPNCGDELLIDALRLHNDGRAEIGNVLDHTTSEDAVQRGDHMGYGGPVPAFLAAMGRIDLEREATRLEFLLRKLHRLEESRLGRWCLRGVGVHPNDWWPKKRTER